MMEKFRKPAKWKIQSVVNVNFIWSKDNDDKQLMSSKSDYIQIMSATKQVKLLRNFFNHFLLDMK